MAAATDATSSLIPVQPVFTESERLALAGFLAGYRGLTREAYTLDRNELGALLVAAGLGPPAEHALISLLALNGLRVSEATGADIEHLGLERGHRTMVITLLDDMHRLAGRRRLSWCMAAACAARTSSAQSRQD